MTDDDYKAFSPDAWVELEKQQTNIIKRMCWDALKAGLIIGAMVGVLFNVCAWWLA